MWCPSINYFWKIVSDLRILDTKSKSQKMITPVVVNLSLIPEKKYKSITKISSRVITGVESTKITACACAANEEGLQSMCIVW